MKNTFKFAWAAALLFVSAFSFAATAVNVDITQLPPELQQQVLDAGKPKPPAAVAELSATSATVLTATKEWTQFGQAIGAGIVATAKELGVAANEFATSDLGKLVVIVLLWKYLGAQLVGIVFGLFIMVAGASVALWLIRSARWTEDSVEYAQIPMLFGLFTVRRVIKRVTTPTEALTDPQSAQQVAGYILFAITFIVGAIAIF